MVKKRILILGAGLTGLSAARHLQEQGYDCEVFEKEAEVGGLCRSKYRKGFIFDYDGHLLHFKHNHTFGLVRKLLKGNLAVHKRSAWVHSHGRYIPYPFQANLARLPAGARQECVAGFINALRNGSHKKKTNSSFLGWVHESFGRGIAKHFMIPYNSKFWAFSLRRLSSAWAGTYVPVPSIAQVRAGAKSDTHTQFGYNAQFWYPAKGGIACLPKAFARETKNIHTGCQAEGIDLAKKEVRFSGGRKEAYDYLISTIPLPDLPRMLRRPPAGALALFKKLQWNSILNVNMGLDRRLDHKMHWVYFPDKDVSFFRVGFFNNVSAGLAPRGKSSLYVEVSYSPHRPVARGAALVSRIKKELQQSGILAKNERICVQDINDIAYGYPIYDQPYQKVRPQILELLARYDMVSCGRYGGWQYLSMEGAMLEGRRAAEYVMRQGASGR